MSTRRTPILVFDVESGVERVASLLYHLSFRELEAIDKTWKLYFEVAELEAIMREKPPSILPDTIGWNWAKKLRVATAHDENWDFYGIEYRDVLQGALVVDLTPHPCEAEVHEGENALCIEFIATAPWNYRPLMDGLSRKPFLKGIGPALINVAISMSRHLGYDGRLVLFSVDKRETQDFYDNVCGMTKVGPSNTTANYSIGLK